MRKGNGTRFARLGLPWVVTSYIVAAAIVIGVLASPVAALALGIPAIILAGLLAYGIFHPGSSLLYPTVTHGPRERACVALTFDDGPDPEVTPRVLDALARHGAHATFFVIGRALAEQPELARRIAAEGHTLGNHSWRHSRRQNFYRRKNFEREIERGEEAICALTGESQPLYRPPIGIKSPALARIAYRRGMRVVAWSLHGRDTHERGSERIAARILKKVRPGDIILMHDGHDLPGKNRPACAEAVELILQGLKKRNLDCVTLPELLQPASHLQTDTAPHGNLTPHAPNLK
ncbi:MAG: polysaccharide deacetylase family protein [Gammaproteobacteria bacterium]